MSLGFQLLIFDRGDWLLSGVAGQGSFMSISGKTFQISFLFALAAKNKSRISSDPANGKFFNSSDKLQFSYRTGNFFVAFKALQLF